MSDGSRPGVRRSCALVLVAGLLLGLSSTLLTALAETNVTMGVAGIVVALCTLVIGQRSAADDQQPASDDHQGTHAD